MKQALIIGASGLVGSSLLDILVHDNKYSKVICLVRKKSGLQYDTLEEHICDFSNLSAASPYFKNIDELYICIGTTKDKTPNKKEYFDIDFGIPTKAAAIALHEGVNNIAVISAMGANAKSSVFYNATKGKMEDYLIGLKIPNLIIVRPSLIVGDRKEKRLGETIATYIMSAISFLIPLKYKAIHAKTISKALHFLMQRQNTKSIWENDELLKITD